MEWVVGILIAIVAGLLLRGRRLKAELFQVLLSSVKERIAKGRVEHDSAEAQARAKVEEAERKLKEIEDEKPALQVDDIDAVISWFNDKYHGSGR